MIPPLPEQRPDDEFLDQVPPHHYVHVLSTDPLVLFTLCNSAVLAGAAAAYAPDLLHNRRALHLLHSAWTLEHGLAAEMAPHIARMRQDIPQNEVLMLCSTEHEVLACKEVGIPAIMGNGLIFTDERLWRPVPPREGKRFAAVYNARLDTFKRHELASEIDDLLLLYNWSLDHEQNEAAERMRNILPHATLANHAGRKYRTLPKLETNAWLAQADVALCLSAVEGCMRASMEYLMAGLPVVSTPSTGGRDRYFHPAYTRIVPPEPNEIARAVAELRTRSLDRNAIRAHASQVLAFERHNLLLTLNAYLRQRFKVDRDVFTNFEPFLGAISREVPVRTWRKSIEAIPLP